jgi:hypothetical protein
VKLKSVLIVLIAFLAVAMPALFVLSSTPAGAQTTPTLSTTVYDGTSGVSWSGSEVTGANAYDTSTISNDGTNSPTGTVTYSFFDNGTCATPAVSTDPVTLVPGTAPNSTVPDSSPTAALSAGSYSYQASYNNNGDPNYNPTTSSCESFAVTTATPAVSTSVVQTGSETGATAYDTATVTGSGFTPTGTLTYSFFENGTCANTATSTDQVTLAAGIVPPSLTTAPLSGGSYSYRASYSGDSNYSGPTASSCELFTVGTAPPTVSTSVFDATSGTAWSGSEPYPVTAYDAATVTGISGFTPTGTLTYSFFENGTCAGTATSTHQVTLSGGSVPNSLTTATLNAGDYSYQASYSGDSNYAFTQSACESFTVAQAPPTTPTITNLPSGGTYGGGFTASVSTTGDGQRSVTSSTPGVCTTNGLSVTYVGVGTCSLNARVAAGANYLAGTGATQSVTVGYATPSTPTITNIPSPANEFFGFTAVVATNGDGTKSVTSNTPGVCSVGTNGLTVTFVGFGTCSLTPSVAQGSDYFGATGTPQTFPVNEASHGYWLVGSDGGIFSFGTAAFHGSMGGIPLQRPVVGITPTSTGNGYWLVASDGGIFSFGDATYYGSIPGVGLHPAGSGLPSSLNAPIVGMVPTFTGQGYFMVASDGGVFAFGDARFEGSCPGIGGCAGAAVAVMPDNTGKGYWLVTSTGSVYAFGDAPFYGASPPSTVPVVDAVATPNGHGYWLLYANGIVANFGDAGPFGGPLGYVDFYNPATAIFPTKDGLGYWVSSARGDVFTYGVAPFLGGLAATGLNGVIIAAYGF